MKKILLTSAFMLAATQSFAGNLVEPMMEPEVVEAATGSSGGAMLVPILMIVLLAAVVASGGSNNAPPVDVAQ
ncbi:hypothetical protein [Profundibacter amoris]|uniref:Ferrochelatase n=1 Tax=Profundibacter amoris TaxID=2171755 RepID=A0A347UGA8_9RHOB|nr:hypothetical protein [Profundibacter amoris]AXX97886.1 hypothetical protein BAR1_08050 [Profundibacter amoris]